MRHRVPYGPAGTALVTGASGGLGAAFALALARRGHDLILVGRRRQRLQEVAEQVLASTGQRARVFVADLACAADLEDLVNQVRQPAAVPLGVLVNNAGYGLHGPFHASDIGAQMDMVQVHVGAAVRLTHAALPGMIARRQGAVINVSSLGAFAPLPGWVTYGATKAYLVAFSRSLAIELGDCGVRVQALCPGFTHTGFQAHQGADLSMVPRFLWMTPEQVVQSSLRCLDRGRVVCVPGTLNRVAAALAPPFGGLVQRVVARRHGWQAVDRATR